MLANVVFIAILLSLFVYVLYPFVNPPSVQMETATKEYEAAGLLQEKKESYVRALRAIKDIDFEYASDKINTDDYQKLKKDYSLTAAECLKEMEKAEKGTKK